MAELRVVFTRVVGLKRIFVFLRLVLEGAQGRGLAQMALRLLLWTVIVGGARGRWGLRLLLWTVLLGGARGRGTSPLTMDGTLRRPLTPQKDGLTQTGLRF